MPCWIHRITPIVLSLIVANTVYANPNVINNNTLTPIKAKVKRVKEITSPKDEASLLHHANIAQRTNDIFTLLASELVYQQGKTDVALATDTIILERTQDPAVAERTMELALSANNIVKAEQIAKQWQQIDPNDNPSKQRLKWELALAKNDTPLVLKYMERVLANAKDYQLRRMFLMLAQFRINNFNATDELNAPVHKFAILHPDMPEAMIADAIYGFTGQHKAQTIKALQQLSTLDNDMAPATQLILNLINIRQPQYLIDFYQQTGFNKLPPKWQSLYIEVLIKNNKLQEAYLILQPLLAKSKSPELYLQAIFLAISQKESTDTIISYVNKTVELGDRNLRSKAALIAAMRYYDEHNIAASRSWVEKVTDPQYAFDKAILMASLESEEKHWALAKKWLLKAEENKKQTIFYDHSDLVRLKTFINSSTLTPQQYEQQLTKELVQVEQSNATDREANLPPLLYLRGLLYADKLNQPEKAVIDLRRYVSLRPNHADGINALGYTMLSLSKDHWLQAQKLLEQAYQLNSQSAAINDSLGWAYCLNGAVEKALPLLEYAFEQQPEAEVAAHLGEAYWQLGKEDAARKTWALGLTAKSSNPSILKQILLQHGIKPADLPVIDNKVTAAEIHNQALVKKVVIDYFNKVAEDTIINDANKVMTNGSAEQRSATAFMVASRYFQQNNNAETLKWLDKVTESKYQADKAYLMGMVELDKGNLPAARQWLQQLQQQKESLIFFNNQNVLILTNAIDKETLSPKERISKLSNLLTQAEKNSETKEVALILYMRGSVYSVQLNEFVKAVDDFRAYVKLEPEDATGWNDLGYTLLRMSKKHWPEALKILQHAYKLDSQSDAVKDSLGWAYYLNGKAEKALPLLRSAYSNLPMNTVAAHLGEVLWQLGQRDEARKIWTEGLSDKENDSKDLMQTLKKFAVKPEDLTNMQK